MPLAFLDLGVLFAGGMLTFFCAYVVIMGLLVLLPGLIANSRNHPQKAGVWVCSLAGFFFPVAWVVALVWAFVDWPPPSPGNRRGPFDDLR